MLNTETLCCIRSNLFKSKASPCSFYNLCCHSKADESDTIVSIGNKYIASYHTDTIQHKWQSLWGKLNKTYNTGIGENMEVNKTSDREKLLQDARKVLRTVKSCSSLDWDNPSAHEESSSAHPKLLDNFESIVIKFWIICYKTCFTSWIIRILMLWSQILVDLAVTFFGKRL